MRGEIRRAALVCGGGQSAKIMKNNKMFENYVWLCYYNDIYFTKFRNVKKCLFLSNSVLYYKDKRSGEFGL